MNTIPEKNTITVSIRDMLLYICSRWRILLIWFVAGAVLLGAFGVYRNMKSDPEPVAAEEAESELTDAEKIEAEMAAASIMKHIEQYDYLMEYKEKTVMMNVNYADMKVVAISFYIDNTKDGEFVRDTAELAAMVTSYGGSIMSSELKSKAAKEFDVPEEEAYFCYDGMISIEFGSAASGIFVVRVYGDNEDYINRIVTLVSEVVFDRTEYVTGIFGKHSISVITDAMNYSSGVAFLDKQNAVNTNINNVLYTVNRLRDELDEASKTYVDAYIRENYEGEYYVIPEDAETEVTKGTGFSLGMINKKFVIIGAFAGLIASAVVIMLKYLLSGKLRNYNDIEYTYDLPVIGTYDDPDGRTKKHNSALDRYIRSKRIRRVSLDTEKNTEIICAKLALIAEKTGINNICVAISPAAPSGASFIGAVKESAAELSIVIAENILRSAEAVRTMRSADGVILLEKMDESRFDTINEEIRMCISADINVLGVIVAE